MHIPTLSRLRIMAFHVYLSSTLLQPKAGVAIRHQGRMHPRRVGEAHDADLCTSACVAWVVWGGRHAWKDPNRPRVPGHAVPVALAVIFAAAPGRERARVARLGPTGATGVLPASWEPPSGEVAPNSPSPAQARSDGQHFSIFCTWRRYVVGLLNLAGPVLVRPLFQTHTFVVPDAN